MPDLSLPPYHVIIVAAGSGTRVGGDLPKQFVPVHGRSVLQRNLDVFAGHEFCASITIVLPRAYDLAEASHRFQAGSKNISFVHGGVTRQASILNGLRSLTSMDDGAFVMIHDAARPYVTHIDLDAILGALSKGHCNVTLAKKVSDTMYDAERSSRPNRDQLYGLQTPQAFPYGVLMHAHEMHSDNAHYTEDTALVEALGYDVHIVVAQGFNDKITYQQDLEMAKKLMASPRAHMAYEFRTGLGYDVHAFEDAPSGRKLVLCGVAVDHKVALKGHSDADVGLHAITDALLGAVVEGDIGRHFPPSDQAFKDMDSAVFLEKARDIVVQKHSGVIVNVDLTLICEAPKITPYADAMMARVAQILSIDQARVSVKATTSERLGFTGRKEGIAAQAVASIKVPESLS